MHSNLLTHLLAALGLMPVAAWLGKIGKNNKIFYIPMIFMLLVILSSLCMTIVQEISAILSENDVVWSVIILLLSGALLVLALILTFNRVSAL